MQTITVEKGRSGPVATFWENLREGRFAIQRSQSTGASTFYPRVMIPGSGETDLEWVDASGRGIVYATTVIQRPDKKGGDYSLVLVDLEEGPRMLARVEGIDPGDVAIGMSVVARIERLREDPEDAQPLVVFYPEAD